MSGRSPRTLAVPLAAALVAAAAAAAGAPAGPLERSWVRAATEHFTFYGAADPAQVAAVATDLERLRAVLVQMAPRGRFDSEVPIRLYLFDSEAELAPFRPAGGGGELSSPTGGPVGFLAPHEHGVYGAVLLADPSMRSSRYVYKQYLHWVLDANLPELPLWFRQGLAELYSTFEVRDGHAHIGLPVEEHVRWLRGTPAGEELVGLAGPFGIVELRTEDLGFFPMAWATVHYLAIGNDAHRQRLPVYLQRAVAGAAADEAFREAFGRTQAEVEREIAAYVAAPTFRYVKVPLASLPEPRVELAEMAPAEVEYRLGDLLAHAVPDAHGRAAARFRAALAFDPGHGLARAGLGWLAEQAGDDAGAVAAYAEAVERAPDDYLVQHLYGDRLLAGLGRRRPESEEDLATLRRAQTALRRVTELAPRFPEGWARLGYALNLDPEGSAEAVAALERAVALLPARMDVALNLLLAHARAGDAAAAEALIASMAARGAGEETLARAHELRLQLAFAEVNVLTRADRLSEAAELLAWIQATTRDPATARRAADQLDLVSRAVRYNRFMELFGGLADQMAAGDRDAARATLEELRTVAKPGRQTEAVEALAARLAGER
jgi:Tfp pilus assembly protein PilF